jgi:predicted flap endonuclease-1-like 5' DNA nuclease
VGIGPKISRELNERGITTFEQLAQVDISYLAQLMTELKWRVNDPATWPEQARQLAAQKRQKSG